MTHAQIPSPAGYQPPPKKPWFKRWWVWLIAGFVVIGVVANLLDGDPESVAVPDVLGLPGDEAADVLADLDLEADFVDATDQDRSVFVRGNWEVERTDPAAGQVIHQGDTVTVYVTKIGDREAAEVPVGDDEAAQETEEASEPAQDTEDSSDETQAPEDTDTADIAIEVLDMSYDDERFVSASYPVSDAFTKNGILRNLKESCVAAIQAAKDQTDNWWEYDTIQCMGMADWTDSPVAVGSANFTGAQLAEISDQEMLNDPDRFWNMATQNNVMPDLR